MSTITIYFTRQFIRGNLVGLRHNDKVDFVNMESAAKWLHNIKARSSRRELDYQIVDYSFQKYWRT